jgi:GGDEF domain-containing protein
MRPTRYPRTVVAGDDAHEDDPDAPLRETIEMSMPPPRHGSVADSGTVDITPMPESTPPQPSESPVAHRASHTVALGEALQLVRFSRRGSTLMITGDTPHGRRLTFEQREDRDGWYVVVAGRRRRPTQRELGLVVASITQEMEAAAAPEGDAEVRSAYRLAAASDQPGMPIKGLQSYRDLLLDEANALLSGQTERLAVVAVEYQAFKRFALRHGHRIGAAFVRALGERLQSLYGEEKMLHTFHKAGKSFRIIIINRGAVEIQSLLNKLMERETAEWLVARVWGREPRTHPDEVHFYIGVAMTHASGRDTVSEVDLSQRLNDDAYRAAKIGQMKGHTALQHAKSDYRTTLYFWGRGSEEELDELASEFEDGPAAVMAEASDFLHELVPANLEGMGVEGNVTALIHKAIARDGFWQGTTAMRIAGGTLIEGFLGKVPLDETQNAFVGGFELGDEFYGIAIENEELFFAWGDLNSAGATRVRAGLEKIRYAAGWRRGDGGGVVGRFVKALEPDGVLPLLERVKVGVQQAYREVAMDESLRVNDAVDISGHLWTSEGELVDNASVDEGENLTLSLPRRGCSVKVLERRANFTARLLIDGVEHPAVVNESEGGPQVKLRIRNAVLSAAICVLRIGRKELEDALWVVREDNNLRADAPMDVLGFLRHVADILLGDEVKIPGKIGLALGGEFDAEDFVKCYTLEEVRERHPGLFFEAVHHTLLADPPQSVDPNLRELIVHTMFARPRPAGEVG